MANLFAFLLKSCKERKKDERKKKVERKERIKDERKKKVESLHITRFIFESIHNRLRRCKKSWGGERKRGKHEGRKNGGGNVVTRTAKKTETSTEMVNRKTDVGILG